MMGARMNFTTAHAQRFIEKILLTLSSEQLTVSELADKLCRCQDSLSKYTAHLRATPKRIQIVGWKPSVNRGAKAPIYVAGSGPDLAQPRQRRPARKRVYLRKPRRIGWPDKALAYLEMYPDSTTAEIAKAVECKVHVMSNTLFRLRKKHKISSTGRTSGIDYWSLVESREVGEPVQRIKRQWTPSPVKKQNPFSALGL